MKDLLRAQYKKIRQQMTAAERLTKSQQITDQLLATPAWQDATTIMLYLSFRDEVTTDAIFTAGWRSGKQMVIPISQVATKEILPCLLTDLSALSLGAYGIRELPPAAWQPVAPAQIDLCLIPGIAFDHYGNRLGFGAGYYDRFLPKLSPNCPKIALAFATQLHPTLLPTDQYDCLMDKILTEQGLITPLTR